MFQLNMSFAKNARLLATRGARMIQSRGYADEMKLTFAAANKTFYDNAEVRQIDVPSFSGSFGILAKHVPTLGKSIVIIEYISPTTNDGYTWCFQWRQWACFRVLIM